MDLSPNDIRNYEFPSQMRGYDKQEVENFKEQVADILEKLKHENLKLSMEVDSLRTQLAGLKQFEDTIKNAAIDARRNADMTVSNAKKEAELIIKKAREELNHSMSSRQQKINEIENKITKTELAKKSYISKVRNLLQSHLDLIEDIAKSENVENVDLKSLDENLQIEDSSEVETKERETIATQPSKKDSIVTEEANAPDKIVPVPPQASEKESSQAAEKETAQADDDLASSLKKAVRDETPEVSQEKSEEKAQAPDVARESQEPSPIMQEESQESSEGQMEEGQAETAEEPADSEGKKSPDVPIDPELAAALESYQQKVANEAKAEAQEKQEMPLDPNEVRVTDARAEDIPQGFVAMNAEKAEAPQAEEPEQVDEKATDKVNLAAEAQDQPTEHNTIDIDKNHAEEQANSGQDDLSKELDAVAAKFEEEMDKAEKGS